MSEGTLRAYLSAAAAGANLRDLLGRLMEGRRGEALSDEAALALAVEVTRAVRAEQRVDRPVIQRRAVGGASAIGSNSDECQLY